MNIDKVDPPQALANERSTRILGGLQFGSFPFSGVTHLTDEITYFCKSTDVWNNALRGAVTVANFIASRAGVREIPVSSKAVDVATSIIETINFFHVFRSLNYFLNGGYHNEATLLLHGEQKLLALAEGAFLVARVVYAAIWMEKHQLIKQGALARGVAALPFFGTISPMLLSQSAHFLGMVIQAGERARILYTHWKTEKNLAFFIVDFANNIAEAASIATMVAHGRHTVASELLALVAALTGVASSMLSPMRFERAEGNVPSLRQ
jgi:hypothetical protein